MRSVPCQSSPPSPAAAAAAFLHEDQLDRLPDALVLTILTKLADVRSLGRCSAVSRRLRSLVPLVDEIHLKIDGVITFDGSSSPPPQPLFSRLRNLVLSTVRRTRRPRYSPAQVLTNFTHLRRLTIELPSGEVDTKDGELLLWRAVYGLDLYRCYILVGTHMSGPEHNNFPPETQSLSLDSMISPLTMTMRRLSLLAPIVWTLPSLRSLVFTDAVGQGTLSVGAESRERCPPAVSAILTSAPVPQNQITAEVRYATYLELAGGIGIQGATLMTVNSVAGESGCRRVAEAFHGPYRAAVEALLKHKAHLLTEY